MISGPDPSKPWEFVGLHRFLPRVADIEGAESTKAADIGVALGRILADPEDPPGLTSYAFRGHRATSKFASERRIAELPHDWYITYVAIEWLPQPPIVYHRMVVIESLDKRPDIGRYNDALGPPSP